jgi:molybdate transport system substrate-binding protein
MNMRLLLTIALPLLVSPAAFAEEINILSAGAVEPGIEAAADVFREETGTAVKIKFATAPAIQQRLGAGEAADLVIAPPAVIDDLAGKGKLDGERRVAIGRVGIGVVVRNGVTKPDVSSLEALKRALTTATAVVYNKASTGLYLDKLFERLGVAEQVRSKETRYPDGAAVLEHIIKGRGNEIGFGAMTEISLYRDKGLQFVGPLPAGAQNYTSYEAAPATAAANREGATAFVSFLGSAAAKQAFAAKGVEQQVSNNK